VEYNYERNYLKNLGYDLNNITFKKISNEDNLIIYIKTNSRNILNNNEENLKEYLKNIIKITRIQKHHNVVFSPPIDDSFLSTAYKENASTSI
jgi:hypothetical protein